VRIDYLFLHAACSWSIASVNRRKVRRLCYLIGTFERAVDNRWRAYSRVVLCWFCFGAYIGGDLT